MTEDEQLLFDLATPASLGDALATIEARFNPLQHAARYCDAKQRIDQRNAEFWRRLAGSLRKAVTLIE